MNDNSINAIYKDLSQIIEKGKEQLAVQVNSTLTLVYWQLGNRINSHVLKNERAKYAKEIIPSLST